MSDEEIMPCAICGKEPRKGFMLGTHWVCLLCDICETRSSHYTDESSKFHIEEWNRIQNKILNRIKKARKEGLERGARECKAWVGIAMSMTNGKLYGDPEGSYEYNEICMDYLQEIFDDKIEKLKSNNRLGESDKKVVSEPASKVASPKTPNIPAPAKRHEFKIYRSGIKCIKCGEFFTEMEENIASKFNNCLVAIEESLEEGDNKK